MEQLRLVGVHDDGEHLIVETHDSTRYRVKIDQQLRQTIQHARRKPPARGRGGSSFGPRDIQARFRAGASVDDVVAESGWEAERVKRYEWPILAERSHMVTAACRVKVSGTAPSHDGYRSVFEGEPKTLEETVDERASQLGVDRRSLDWDAWLREDQLWNVQLSFSVSDPQASGLDTDGPALWSYNPANQTVRAENDWARTLGEQPRETGPLGVTAPVSPAAPTPVAPTPSAQLRHLQHEASQADDLLDVLQSRRGRRLGSDEDGDDRLAEILGRGMGRVEQRPRPIDAPEDSPVFDQPIQPAASRVAEEQALQGEGIEIVDDSTPYGHDAATPAGDPTAPLAPDEAAPQHLAPGDTETPDQNDDVAPDAHADEPAAGPTAHETPRTDDSTPTEATTHEHSAPDEPLNGDRSETPEEDHTAANAAPGPRGRTPRAKRSSVPSWDDIVFGNRT